MSENSIEDLATWDVLVGHVVGDWDRAGLKVKPFSDAPNRFAAGARFCVEQNGQRRLLEVKTSRAIGHTFVLDVGLKTPEEAASFKGAQLFIHRSMRAPLPEGEFYVTDMLGMKVVTENGDELGKVEEILETPAHDVYVTPHAMIPAHEQFVVQRDWENHTLIVRDVAGLRTDEKN